MIMSIIMWPVDVLRMLGQSILLALGQIWSNKVRGALTTSGIFIGVLAVTLVIALLTGMKNNVLTQFETFGTNKIYIFPDRPDTGRQAHASWSQIRFTPELFDNVLARCESLQYQSRLTRLDGTTIRYANTDTSVSVTGIEPDWHKIENRLVTEGRPFSVADQNEARQVCLITTNLRDDLHMDKDCVGQSVLIDNRRFVVVGLVEPMPSTGIFSSGSNSAEAFIPFATAWKMNPNGFMFDCVTSRSPEVSEDARAEFRAYMRSVRKLQPDDPDNFDIEAMSQFLDQFKSMSVFITIVAIIILSISLVVGGVGIMNIMLVSVSERTREIGLRKAVGARPSAVLMQFLVEAVTLCFAGGLLGIVFSEIIILAVRQSLPTWLGTMSIPIWALVMSFGFAAGVGVIFGMFPAIKASRLDPIEALRHE